LFIVVDFFGDALM